MDRKQIIRVIALFVFLAFLYFVREVLYPVIIALILFYLLDPLVKRFSGPRPGGLGLNRTLSVLLAFVLSLVFVILFFSFVVPPFAREFEGLAENFPAYVASAENILGNIRDWYKAVEIPPQVETVISDSLQNILNYMLDFAQQTAVAFAGMLSQFIYLITIPILAFYLLRDKEKIYQGIIGTLPQGHQNKTRRILSQINSMLYNYFKGVFLLCLLVGTLCGAGLFLLGVKYFLILGLIAAITEFIPVIGPFIGAVPAVVIAFLGSPVSALYAVALYIGIQSIENSILVPRVLGEKINLHPVTVILAILVLGKLIGGWGLFFAAPLAAIIKILYSELRKT
jgi:predicted PurR-regulated permease PerM